MPSPVRLALRQRGRNKSPGSGDDDGSGEDAPGISEYPQTPSPSAAPAAASGSMEYVVNTDASTPFAASKPRRQTFSEAKEDVQAITQFAQTLEVSQTATPAHIAASAPASSRPRAVRAAAPAPAPASSRLPPPAQLPAPKRSCLKVEAPSTPSTVDRPATPSTAGRPAEDMDLDALLSEVERQSDGTCAHPFCGSCILSSPGLLPTLVSTPHSRSARLDGSSASGAEISCCLASVLSRARPDGGTSRSEASTATTSRLPLHAYGTSPPLAYLLPHLSPLLPPLLAHFTSPRTLPRLASHPRVASAAPPNNLFSSRSVATRCY